MQNVLANLGKKDSVTVLLEEFEGTLHKADHISEEPSNPERHLLRITDLEEDDYSLKLKAQQRVPTIVNKKA